jgi:predicted nuclease of predicted toxin-antitoxin system
MPPNSRASASSRSVAARHEVQGRREPAERGLQSHAGHDATSVGRQGLGGADDARIYQVCQTERRALITLDVDFANVQTYEPKSSAGVVVLRLAQQDRQRVLDAVAGILPILEREPLRRRLWIVEGKRVRIRA